MNSTPSATTHNKQFDEELRKEIVGSLSRAQVRNVDVMGEATIEREADHIIRLVAHHTKEAERRARIDELKALLDAEVINMYAQHIKEMEK